MLVMISPVSAFDPWLFLYRPMISPLPPFDLWSLSYCSVFFDPWSCYYIAQWSRLSRCLVRDHCHIPFLTTCRCHFYMNTRRGRWLCSSTADVRLVVVMVVIIINHSRGVPRTVLHSTLCSVPSAPLPLLCSGYPILRVDRFFRRHIPGGEGVKSCLVCDHNGIDNLFAPMETNLMNYCNWKTFLN